jgi:serine/threonine-protein kinase
MSPEQARRAADAGPAADLYMVGAVLYHMLTGEPPYGKDPPVSPLILMIDQEPERPRAIEPSIPEGLEAVIQHAMARVPGGRPASAAALDQELAAFEPEAPARPADEPSMVLLAELISRHARVARPAATVVAVAVAVLRATAG